MSFDATKRDKLNYEGPASQDLQLGTEIYDIVTDVTEIQESGLYHITAEVAADATSGQSITVPFACEIVDVIVQARATSASGTATVRVSTNAVTDAIVCAVDTTIVRAGTIDATYSTLTTASSLNVITHGATDRGLITIVVKR